MNPSIPERLKIIRTHDIERFDELRDIEAAIALEHVLRDTKSLTRLGEYLDEAPSLPDWLKATEQWTDVPRPPAIWGNTK